MPAGLLAASAVSAGVGVIAAAAGPERPAVAAAPLPRVLLRSGFDRPDGPNRLIANEYGHWSPDDPDRVTSRVWDMTSGSLFSVGGLGWTGVPDDRSPDRYSRRATDSQVFRLNTVRGDFGNVVQQIDVRINRFVGSGRYPPRSYDGAVLWPRYETEFRLYFAYLLRKDGRVEITKKCPGHVRGGDYYNGGSYFVLRGERRFGGRPRLGRWYRLASSVQDEPDGSVVVRVFRDGRLAAEASDHGRGCAPIHGGSHLGVRTDNVDANFDQYRVTTLSAAVPVRCPGALVGALRRSAGGTATRATSTEASPGRSVAAVTGRC